MLTFMWRSTTRIYIYNTLVETTESLNGLKDPTVYRKYIMEVTFDTSMGQIVFELYPGHAPKTCRNFINLANRGYYNSTTFHRIIPNFMIQGGDPTATGRGGVSIYGEKFEDEISDLKHTGAGILSMANSGPNTNGSQFFITLAPTPWLDGKHTVFGRVKSGMKTVERMGLVKVDGSDKPVQDVVVRSATGVEG